MSIEAFPTDQTPSPLQLQIYKYLVECAVELDVEISRLPEGHSLGKEAVALFNHSYLRQLYHLTAGQNVMPRQFINDGIDRFETWTCFDKTSGKLVSFIIFGKFKMYEDWPIWQKKNTPPNSALVEIKMLAAKKGYGRLMFALALMRNMNNGFKGAVLEVLGGRVNSRAVAMYKDFGFEHQKAYDPDQGPYVQLRDKHGQIIYLMTLIPKNRTGDLITLDIAKRCVDLERLRASKKERLRRLLIDEASSDSEDYNYHPEDEDVSIDEFETNQESPITRIPHAELVAPPDNWDDEVRKLDDLLASGFIFAEEHSQRMEELKAFFGKA